MSVSRRENKKREKLARIEAAARALFAEKGFHGTTTRAIAERAEIGVGTLFLYFKEKRDLLVHITRADVDAEVARIFDELEPAQTHEQLISVLGEVLTQVCGAYEKQGDLARVFIKEILFLDPDGPSKAWTSLLVQRVEELLVDARERGLIRREPNGTPLSLHLFGLHYFALARWLGANGSVTSQERDQHVRGFVEQVLNGARA